MQKLLSTFSTKTFSIFSYKVIKHLTAQGPVVQSMVSLTSSLRGQLVKCFTTLLLNTLIFFVEKMREAFAQQKLHTFLQEKILVSFRY